MTLIRPSGRVEARPAIPCPSMFCDLEISAAAAHRPPDDGAGKRSLACQMADDRFGRQTVGDLIGMVVCRVDP
jgi:hypothetical protein